MEAVGSFFKELLLSFILRGDGTNTSNGVPGITVAVQSLQRNREPSPGRRDHIGIAQARGDCWSTQNIRHFTP